VDPRWITREEYLEEGEKAMGTDRKAALVHRKTF
jgi:hypothetical protein